MKRLWVALPILLIAGCDQQANKAPEPEWVLIPATLKGGLNPTIPLPARAYAWKMNTRTGELRVCEYQEEVFDIQGKMMSPSLSCSITEKDGLLQ
jgi:hypothetical protein